MEASLSSVLASIILGSSVIVAVIGWFRDRKRLAVEPSAIISEGATKAVEALTAAMNRLETELEETKKELHETREQLVKTGKENRALQRKILALEQKVNNLNTGGEQ